MQFIFCGLDSDIVLLLPAHSQAWLIDVPLRLANADPPLVIYTLQNCFVSWHIVYAFKKYRELVQNLGNVIVLRARDFLRVMMHVTGCCRC